MELEADIWGQLPQDLRERVFAWLPPESFCRFRCVHKQWDELLHSQVFLDTYSQACKLQKTWILLALYRPFESPVPQCWLYNPSLQKWYKHLFPFFSTENTEVLASGGGLLCCQTDTGIFICNPFTGCWTQLFPPYAFNLFSDSVALWVDEVTHAYKVILIVFQSENDTFEVHVFDSVLQMWEKGSRAPYGHKVTNLVCVSGCLYCVTINWDVVSYNLDLKEWSRIEVPDDLRPCLLEHDGRLLMGNAFISDSGYFAKVVVFELLQREVRQITMMGDEFLQELNSRDGDNYGIQFLEGSTICIRLDRDNQKLLIYEPSSRSWQWLPECPAQGFSDVDEPCYIFKPRLDAHV